jgi:acetyl esterase/lipase
VALPHLVPVLQERLPLLDGVAEHDDRPPAPEDMAARDAFMAAVPGYSAPEVDVEEVVVDGPHGPVPVRVYRRDAGPAPAGLVWAHGGAFLGGDLDMPEADVVAREIAARSGVVVVSVDYRLCHDGIHFPVPHDDVHAVTVWATSLDGVPQDRWSVGGASAGGNLAGGVAQRLRDEGRPPYGAALIYPVLHAPLPASGDEEHDARIASLPPALRFSPATTEFLNANYLGPNDADVPYAFPGHGGVAGLPPHLVVVCEYDDLLPSGVRYAQQLADAGVEVEVDVVHGVPHGHLNMPGLPEALATIDRIAAFLSR